MPPHKSFERHQGERRSYREDYGTDEQRRARSKDYGVGIKLRELKLGLKIGLLPQLCF
jgi:hypothetical protein